MQRAGECMYCHQTRMVEADADVIQEDVDHIATEECTCPEAVKARDVEKAKMERIRAMNTIDNLFIGDEEPVGELFRMAYDLVGFGKILSVTVRVSENRTYTETYNAKEGAPQIKMKEKQEATTVLS